MIVARERKRLKIQGARRADRRRHTRRYGNRLLKTPQKAEDKAKSAEKAPCTGAAHEYFEALFNAVSRLPRRFQQPVQEGGASTPWRFGRLRPPQIAGEKCGSARAQR